ncbi:hypothetical protein PPGU19_090490 (plasmid) [Paraburkholderia sp. PGU19]|uniref:hypothetical protein n=1 Tax=Paraburkholderia sp. PGU19 TaxID=2735434 RepID=UPI0015D9DF2C|nr:hypothetical protein [Paraburkholderia sp. PGU19]BCG04481.1 hypothetical protein PPGU19_090490 [Paraburkholderia sp. PGU19]
MQQILLDRVSATEPHYAALANHHALRMVYQAQEHAIERAMEWLATEFEARGPAVDRNRYLINGPGYC